MEVLHKSNPIALWHEIVHQAEVDCSITLKDDVEAYLVFLLSRYMIRPDIIKQIMATEFLAALSLPLKGRELALQNVGDKCLVISGLFPKLAEKRLVKINYFVNLGQTSYGTLSKAKNDIYHSLSNQFVKLMDVLQSIRSYDKECPDLLPLQAFELWQDTGSERALSTLKHYYPLGNFVLHNFKIK